MDILFFLKLRTGFIRQHYDACAKPFVERMRLIDAAEPPFEDANCGEEDEPAYLQEWMDADTSLQLVGMSCVSLLSDSLKLYLNLLQERHPRFEFTAAEKRRLKNDLLPTFRDALGEIYATDWSDTGIDFAVIEQVMLARNRAQHGTHLTGFGMSHDDHTLAKHPIPFFISEMEARSLERSGTGSGGFLAPMVKVTRGKLFAAIDEVERLGDWIDANGGRALRWIEAQRALREARASDDGPAAWPGLLPAFVTRLSQAAERAIELQVNGTPLIIEIEPGRLDDEAYRQSLLERAKIWRGGSDLSTIYVFSYETAVPQQLVGLLRNDANIALRKIGAERAFAKVNRSEESRCLYVGHTFKIETRLRDHFGFGTASTSSLHLRHWDGHPHEKVMLTAYRLSSNDRLLVPWLEEFLWDELRPLLGKRGGR